VYDNSQISTQQTSEKMSDYYRVLDLRAASSYYWYTAGDSPYDNRNETLNHRVQSYWLSISTDKTRSIQPCRHRQFILTDACCVFNCMLNNHHSATYAKLILLLTLSMLLGTKTTFADVTTTRVIIHKSRLSAHTSLLSQQPMKSPAMLHHRRCSNDVQKTTVKSGNETKFKN